MLTHGIGIQAWKHLARIFVVGRPANEDFQKHLVVQCGNLRRIKTPYALTPFSNTNLLSILPLLFRLFVLLCLCFFHVLFFPLYSFPPVDISLSLTPKLPDLRLQLFIVKPGPLILRPLAVISKIHNRRRIKDRILLALGREIYW